MTLLLNPNILYNFRESTNVCRKLAANSGMATRLYGESSKPRRNHLHRVSSFLESIGIMLEQQQTMKDMLLKDYGFQFDQFQQVYTHYN